MALTDKTMRLLLSAMGSPEARDELLSNIENIQSDEIAAGAVTDAKVATGIDAAKLADGSVSNTEFQYISTLTSNAQTQLNAKQSTTLTDGNILVGNGSNVATSVTMSGAATLSNAGVLALAANGITSDKISTSDGVRKMHRFTVDYTLLNASGFPALFGVAIPDNAIVVRSFYDVITTFAGDGDDGSTIKIGIEDQDDDVKAAVAINDVSNPWDVGIKEGIQVNTAATMVKLSASRSLAVTWTAGGTDTALTAGQMVVFLEYVESV